MILNRKKFKKGLQKITLAILFAFIGPVLFVLGSGKNLEIILSWELCLGVMFMAGSFIIGLIGLNEILNSFFEQPNE